jgi:hypothetical protein
VAGFCFHHQVKKEEDRKDLYVGLASDLDSTNIKMPHVIPVDDNHLQQITHD